MILKKAPRTIQAALAVIFLGIAALFVFIFGDWIRSAIVIPVLYFFWLISKVAKSIDQQILWAGLFLLSVFGLFQVYLSSSRRTSSAFAAEKPLPNQGRVRYWLVYMNLMLVGVYHRSYFSEELKRLILSVLSLRERQLPQEVEKRIINGDLDVPPQIKTLFTAPRIRTASSFSEKAIRTMNALIHPETRENRPEKLEDLQTVIAFLEEQVEKK
jgi:hypothetical protein